MPKKNVTPKAAAPAPANASTSKPAVAPKPAAPKAATPLPQRKAEVPQAPSPMTPPAKPTATKAAEPATPIKTRAAAKPDGQFPSSDGATVAAISTSDIAMRAYFISEKRRAEGRAGDESQDWIEAERQIASERGTAPKSKKR